MTGGGGEQGRGRRSERHVSSATTTMARREAPSSIIVNQSLHNRQRHATIMQRLSQFLWFSICSFCFCYSTRLKISSTRPAVISDRNGLNTRVQLLLNLWMFLYCLVEGFHNKNNFLLLPHL